MTDRPPHIPEATWERMPWHARERAVRGVARMARATMATMPRAPQRAGVRRRVRIYRVEPHSWEITDGVSTARTASAEAAWRLLDHLTRTA